MLKLILGFFFQRSSESSPFHTDGGESCKDAIWSSTCEEKREGQ